MEIRWSRYYLLYALLLQLCLTSMVICDSGGSEDSESESGSGEDNGEEAFNDGNEKVSFLDVISLSVSHMVNASDAKEKGEILNTYYFTVKKADSIWPKAIKETEDITKVEFKERELADMENAIKNVYRRILECNLNNAGQKKKKKNKSDKARDLVKCYMTLGEFIEDGFIDFAFPRGTIQGQTQMFEMNMAYNVMVLLIYHMLSGMEQAAMDMNSFETQLKFYRIAEAFVNAVDTAAKNSIDTRLEAISGVEICNIQEALWTEFPVHCETARSKRDAQSVHGIGGSPDIFQLKYRATVKDDISGFTICSKEKTTNERKDAKQVRDELRSECGQARETYVTEKREEMKKYYEKRAAPILKDLPKLWGSSKLKLTKVKEELTERQRKTSKSSGKNSR